MALVQNWNGSWGLPDFGITEAVGGLLGQPKTSQGGSNIQTGGALTQTYWDPAPVNNYQNTLQSQNAVRQIPAAIPAYRAPAPVQTQPQNTGGGGDDIMQYYQGWPEGAARQDFASAFGGDINKLRTSRGFGSSGGGQPDQSAMLNSIYDPLFRNIDLQQQNLTESELPNALAGLKSSTTQLNADLKAKQDEALRSVGISEQKTYSNKESAMTQALNQYRAMNQNAMSRFGGRNSAGLAASEISQKEFSRQAGGVEKQYAEQFGLLTEQRNKVDSFVLQEGARLSLESANAERELQAEFRRRVDQLRADKNTLESQRGTGIMAIAQEMQKQAQAVANAKTSALINLGVWRDQQAYLINSGLSNIQQTLAQAQYTQSLAPSSITAPQTTFQAANYFPASPTAKKDEFGALTNPFNS